RFIRSLTTKPMRQRLHRATSPNRIAHPARAISAGDAPLAYAAATIDPALTPVMQWIGIPCRSNVASTPACATPRAKPPPSASPIFGCAIGSAGAIGRGIERWKRRAEKKLLTALAAFMTPSFVTLPALQPLPPVVE